MPTNREFATVFSLMGIVFIGVVIVVWEVVKLIFGMVF